MQFRDLQKQYAALRADIDSAIARVCASAHFIGGDEVSALERELMQYVGATHCISCANGTDALSLALMAWELGPGDAVFVPDFTFFASAEAPALIGATPILVDVDAGTFNIDPRKLEQAIKAVMEEGRLTPRAVVTVDLFGLPADYPAIRSLCDTYGLLILEDAAQAFGGSIKGQKAGSFGDISITSFFPAKPLGCYGDGGAVFTDNHAWATLIQSYAVHGKGTMKYDNVRIGMNSRLDAIQAAILRVKLAAFKDHELEAVNGVAEYYGKGLKCTGLRLPVVPDGYYSSWAQYTVCLPEAIDRNALQKRLKQQGIPTMVYYPKPLSQQPALENTAQWFDDNGVSEELCRTVLSLPIHPYLETEELDQIISAVSEFCNTMGGNEGSQYD
ncbi:MAG: DegT/DnrJ/EryC1/StrS family aminotransferase [Coriobacteriia bacterium]|nr:DegT/DnrJ/EryC1/StrS family aminotransferase [Coriobacteriia bacterium]